MDKVRPCMWFASGGKAVAELYMSLIPDSRMEVVLVGGSPDDPLLVDFTLAGVPYQALTALGGPEPSAAASISIATADQAETDRLWDALLEGGSEMQCGWLRDRWGVAWQIVPRRLTDLMADPDPERAARVPATMTKMIEIDIATLEAA
ncbi:MAG: VOC family protein [Shimia sp.]